MSTKYLIKTFEHCYNEDSQINEWISKHCKKVINVSASSINDIAKLVAVLYVPKKVTRKRTK